MSDESIHTASMHWLVERIHDGDRHAEDELVGRLERLTRKMLQTFPRVSQWEDTGDVLQNALVRLLRTLGKLKRENTRAFFDLATEHLRRELLDLKDLTDPTAPPSSRAVSVVVPQKSPFPGACKVQTSGRSGVHHSSGGQSGPPRHVDQRRP